MMEVSSLLFWGMAEALLLLLLLLMGLGGVLYYRRAQDQKAVRSLVLQLKKAAETRNAGIKQALSERYGYQGEDLGSTLKQVRKQESLFYRALLQVYLKRDARRLPSLHRAFEQAMAPWLQLSPQLGAAPPGVSGSEDATHNLAEMEAELERLRQENQELSDEMRITMDTLGRVLSEYATVFSEEDIDQVEEIPVGDRISIPSQLEGVEQLGAAVAVAEELAVAGQEEVAEAEDDGMELDDLFHEVGDADKEPAASESLETASPDEVVEAAAVNQDLAQDDLDALIDQALETAPPVAEKAPEVDGDLAQDDLDALFDQAQEAAPKAAEEVPEADEDLAQDDLDALFDQAQEGTPEVAEEVAAADEELTQDDLDALFDQSEVPEPKNETVAASTEEDEAFDLDALFDEAASSLEQTHQAVDQRRGAEVSGSDTSDRVDSLADEIDLDEILSDDGFSQEDLDSLIDEALQEAELESDEKQEAKK